MLPPSSANSTAGSHCLLLRMLLGYLKKLFQTSNQTPPLLMRHAAKDTSYKGLELSRCAILQAFTCCRADDGNFSTITCAWFPNNKSSFRE
jgi:hypothetical protein